MTDLEVALGVVVVVLFTVVAILVLLVENYQKKAQEFHGKWQTRQTGAYTLGTHQAIGDLSQVLGTFSMLSDYEQVILLSTTSAQSSMDLLGVKADSLDFIELKKRGADLAKSEKKIRRLVNEKKVRYIIKDVELPANVRVTERIRHEVEK